MSTEGRSCSARSVRRQLAADESEDVRAEVGDADVGRWLRNLDDRRVQSLLAALLHFDLLPQGFRNRDLRETVAGLRGLPSDDYGASRMTYDLRRFRLRSIIERIPRTQPLSAHRQRAVRRPRLPAHAGASPGSRPVGDP